MGKFYCHLLTLLVAAVFSFEVIDAQEPVFYEDIQKFKKEDSISFPQKHGIVLVGSSSFTKWQDVQSYFPGYKIVNRGFGGSTLPDVIRYAGDIIIPYQPKQVIIYCGDNDLASADTITPQTVTNRFKTLFHVVRSNLPETKISYVSIKPSPSRKHLMPKMKQVNQMVKSLLKKQSNTSFIDIYNKMLLPGGRPRPEIFVEDSLHMNEKGYAIWKKEIHRHLVKKK